jgi:tripartite-type tricarboxylate transporter receptor subunit TctC
MKRLLKLFSGVLLLLSFGLSPSAAMAQSDDSYPKRPVRIVVPFGAGTTTDQVARFLAQHLSDETKQPFIIDNKPGANGSIALRYAITQPADGYTFVVGTNTTFAANVSLFKSLGYDPVKDYTPISNLIVGGVVLAISASSSIQSVPELIEAMKKTPGKWTFGTANSSSLAGGEVLRDIAQVNIVNVPYKTLPAAITDLIGGQIDMVFGDAPAIMPSVRSGKLRALGVSTQQRIAAFSEIPTFIEQGVKGYEVTGWVAAFALSGTPAAVITKLNRMMVKAMHTPEADKMFGKTGWLSVPGTPDQLGDFQRNEIDKWARLVKSAGIQPE